MFRSDFAGAIELFEKAMQADPNYAPALVGLSTAYYWLVGDEPRSLELAQKAVELAPDSVAAYVALSHAQYALYNGAASLEAAEKAVALDAKNAEALAALARARLADNQHEAALDAARQAIELQADLTVAYDALGGYYRAIGDGARARAAYERALALQPDFVIWHVTLGNLWRAMDRCEEAQAEYAKAQALMPDSADVLLSLAYLAMSRADYEKAEAHLKAAAELIPDAPQLHLAWGRLYRAQHETDKARTALRKALERRPNYPPALYLLGWTYLDEGECDLAVRQFQTLITEQPHATDGLVGMGFARLCDDDPAKALEYLRKAVKLDPYNEWAHMGLGAAYAAQERWDEARLAHAQALQVGLADATAHRELGSSLYEQDEYEAARAEFEVALRLAPESAANSATYVSLGFLDSLDEDFAQAETHARTALRLDPKSTQAQLALGLDLVRQDKTAEAIPVLKGLIEKEPENSYAHYILGLAYKGEKRFSEARKSLETFVALSSRSSETSQATKLIEALKQGYYLTEAKALADLTEDLEDKLEREVAIEVTDMPEVGRTLVITLTSDPEQKPRDVLIHMAASVAFGAPYLARIDPAIAGGLLVRLVEKKQVLFTMSVGNKAAGEFADGMLGAQEFIKKMKFKRETSVASRASVNEIKANVSSTRELTATVDVPYQLLTEETLRERYESELNDEDLADLRDVQALLALLGVIEPDTDLAKLLVDLNTEQIVGFYSLEEKTFYLVDRGEATASDQLTVAHEYVHALQDQHYDLRNLHEEGANSDEQDAIQALIEGDATLAMLLYGDKYIMLYDMMASISEVGGLEETVLKASPTFVRETEQFPYLAGMTFVSALYNRGGWDAVNDAYAELPRSTEQILHPERYRDQDAPLTVTLPDLAPALGAPWQEADRDVMGELGLRLYLREHVGPAMAELAAEGWGGDSYVLLRKGEQGPYLLAILTQWDDQDEADQFWALYQVAMSHRRGYEEEVRELIGAPDGRWWQGAGSVTFARQEGDRVLMVIGPDMQAVEAVLTGLKTR